MKWKKSLQKTLTYLAIGISALSYTPNHSLKAAEKSYEEIISELSPVCQPKPEIQKESFFSPLEEKVQAGKCIFKKAYQNWVYHQSQELAGIRHPERFPLDVLEETNLNLLLPEYRLGDDLVVFFVSAYDYPLQPNQKILSELRFFKRAIGSLSGFEQNYKLLVFESRDVLDIRMQLQKLEELYPFHGIAALGAIGHGLEGMIQLNDELKPSNNSCLNQENIGDIFGPYLKKLNEDAPVFLISCLNGNGKERKYNLANAAARAVPGHDIYSCTSPLTSVKFYFDRKGKLTKKPVELSSLLPQNSCIYRANSRDYIPRLIMGKLFGKD